MHAGGRAVRRHVAPEAPAQGAQRQSRRPAGGETRATRFAACRRASGDAGAEALSLHGSDAAVDVAAEAIGPEDLPDEPEALHVHLVEDDPADLA